MKLELIRSPISSETIQALEQLLEDARAGIYTGFVIGLTRPRLRFSVHCVGEACERPAWARAICASLDDELAALIAADDRDTSY